MRDRREEILTRLEALLNTIVMDPPVVKVVRNIAPLPDEQRPGIVLLDSDETVKLKKDENTRGLGVVPMIMSMSPQVFYLAGNLPENTTIGQHLNLARRLILSAIFYDAELHSIVSRNGSISYNGLDNDLRTGAPLEGQVLLLPIFNYPLIPGELKE